MKIERFGQNPDTPENGPPFFREDFREKDLHFPAPDGTL